MASFVLSVLGDDRSGLVEALSGVVAKHGGNWDRSHMTQLAGKFAGLVLVSIPQQDVESFLEDLRPLEARGLFDITVEEAQPVDSRPAHAVVLDLVGTDHPGIVHDLSHLLASHGVSFVDLETSTSNAPMAGGTLFHAKAVLTLPPGLDRHTLIDALEALAADLMVDVELIESVDDLASNEI